MIFSFPRSALAFLGCLFFSISTFAQLTNTPAKPIVGARMPALSPDGKKLVFVYRGDLWIAPSKGGPATSLTQHVEMDAYPVFSPDGEWIAFSSKRNGNFDLFAVPASGGPARQLTWHSGTELTQGWSPDSKELLFTSKREFDFTLYALDVQTLKLRKICDDYAAMNYASFSPDGKKIVYGRYGFHWSRPRYVGSAAAQIWVYDLEKNQRQAVTQDEFQHLWSQFLPDGEKILSVSVGVPTPSASSMSETISKVVDNASRTPNLWIYDLNGKGRQLTQLVGGAVRWPSVARQTGDVAFEHGLDLWFLKSGKKDPAKIELFVSMDEKQNAIRREKLNSGTDEAEPTPDGKTIAFGLKGEIWTISVDKPKGVAGRSSEFARRLTEWAGDDSDFCWSNDGKKLYFTSDRQFNSRIFVYNADTQETTLLWDRNEDAIHPRLSPNGKMLGFWVTGKEGGIYVMDLETGEKKRVTHVPGAQWRNSGGGSFEWSPDNKWIAFTRRSYNYAWNIWIVPAQGGEAINVTRLNAFHGMPTWSLDGKFLFFVSNRDGQGLYALPLQKETARNTDTDLKFEKPKDEVKVDIDFENITRRIRKVGTQAPQSDLTMAPDGALMFLSEGDVWQVTYDGKESKRITTGGGKSQFRVLKDSRRGFYIQGGELYTIRFDAGNSVEKVTFTADWERDIRAERKAAFTQFWRSYQRGFYDPNFHGRDWEAIRKQYEPLLDAVETNEEFANLLTMMIGELETSHAEVTASTEGVTQVVTPQLGFSIDYAHPGPGLKVAHVPYGTPGWYSQTEIKVGEYVIAINGREVAPDESLYRFINDKQEREFEFLVNDKPSREGARTVRYKVLTPDEWNDLNYKNRTDRLRRYVEEKSGGKMGYLHLSAMSAGQQAQFEREAYEYISGKQAMIIDVRFNSGGNISDTLIDWLERKPHGYMRPRDIAPEPMPHYSWEKPIIVLMNEHSYSNSEMFPYAMRHKGLARLVGMPTPGYVIWTDSMKLVDGTNARMPGSGVFRIDGTNQENDGEDPDYKIWMTPDDWVAGKDPQLDEAIRLLSVPQISGTKKD